MILTLTNIVSVSAGFETEAAGSIGGYSYISYNLGSYDATNVISWGFTGASNSLDVWLFDEENFDLFDDGLAATGSLLSTGYIQTSGKFQCPFSIYSDYYLVIYNPHFLSVSYTNVYATVADIEAVFGNIYYRTIDSDDDRFDDSIEIEVGVGFDVYCYVEGYITVKSFLRELSTDKIIDTDEMSEYIENSGTFTLLLEKQSGESGDYRVELEIYSFAQWDSDDTLKPAKIYELHKTGKLLNIIFRGCLFGGLSLLVVAISIILIVVIRRRRSQPITQTCFTQPIQQHLCPNCKKEIVETGHKFCEHCGAAL